MSKQQRSKLTNSATPEKTRHDKSFVQLEGELTEAQLEALAGGLELEGGSDGGG